MEDNPQSYRCLACGINGVGRLFYTNHYVECPNQSYPGDLPEMLAMEA